MRQDTPELSAPEVLHHAVNTLHEHLPLHADGYKCTTADLFNILVGVAATKGTIESVCADLVGTPDPQTIRGYFKEQLRVEELAVLETQLKAALAAEIPPPRAPCPGSAPGARCCARAPVPRDRGAGGGRGRSAGPTWSRMRRRTGPR